MDGDNFSLAEQFKDVNDPRINRTKLHKLVDIIVFAICASVGGADGFDSIEVFAEVHEEWFRKFLELPNGIPSHDTFARVFSRIDPQEFRASFAKWTTLLAGIFASEPVYQRKSLLPQFCPKPIHKNQCLGNPRTLGR